MLLIKYEIVINSIFVYF